MKYWTKEWYQLSQQTGLHFGLRVHKGAGQRDEALYERLYKRKERQFLVEQRDIYEYDPRNFLKQDGVQAIPLHKLMGNEEITEEDVYVYQMSEEEKSRIEKAIAEYDAKPPFDENVYKQIFREQHEWKCNYLRSQLTQHILSQIADIRLHALGYCTKEVLVQLKQQSKENKQMLMSISEAALKELNQQDIPDTIREKLNFHDCIITHLEAGENLIITFDNSGGFTKDNKLMLAQAKILHKDEIVGSHWIYHELYRVEQGYELHVLCTGVQIYELIVQCRDIVISRD